MKKKYMILVLLAVFLLPAGVSAADTGIGAAFSYGLGTGSGASTNIGSAALSISTPVLPGTVQNVTLRFGEGYFAFGITDDWWVIRRNITSPLDFYLGLGFYTYIGADNWVFDYGLGGRAPLGLTVFPVDFLEIFVEFVPAMGIGFSPEFYFPSWDLQGAIGARIWF